MAFSLRRAEPEQQFDLAPQAYVELADNVAPSDMLIVDVLSDGALDVFILDQGQFEIFRIGATFQYFGQQRVLEFHREFKPTHAGTWHVVVFNPGSQIARVSLRAVVRRPRSLFSGSR